MRSIAVLAVLLALAAAPVAQAGVHKPPAHKGVSGQCRGRAGEAVRCEAGAATDLEGVPLAARAAVIRTSAAQTDAPPGAVARCRNGGWSTSKSRSRACARAGGVARWIR